MLPNREDLVIQRILIRHGFTKEMAQSLLLEMQNTLDHFAENPVDLTRVGAESGSHDHSGR
jgi:glutamate decarboxylase